MHRLRKFYTDIVVPKLINQFGYKSVNDVPRIEKIVVNRGLDESCQNNKTLDALVSELTQVTGQRFYVTRSKKAISNFKLKQDVPIGMCVTLRRDKMYSFFDRLVNLALPRIRDFQGVKSSGFDRSGGFSFGLSDQSMFPEIDFDKINKFKGMDIVIVTTAKTRDETYLLLKELGMPFK
uniref:Large ribosomal subunit protein uL5c n=1 Tax=Lepocinclis playfairiana TaxID=1403386 RepID=A0A3G3LLH1_9EUGL|nr:ribosomal protein L5 [Lepocinclis playfairiana]AYQ93562.1 ribosomal protein L5 [Lepocinclis playfairiana]